MAKSYRKGHLIVFIDEKWIYADTKKPIPEYGGENREFAKCCGFGEFKCDVEIKGHLNKLNKPFYVDKCIADIVQALNDSGLSTSASCCGHNRLDGSILLRDGRSLRIKL